MERAEAWFGRFFLAATSVLIVAALLGARLSTSCTLACLVAGVVLLGLPHGALDPLVARKAFATYEHYSDIAFYAVYLAAVVGYALLWLKLPTLGLVSFLMIAAYHFGSDWYPRGNAFTRLSYGLAVVTLPAVFHGTAEAHIFTVLGTHHAQTLADVSTMLAPLAVIAATAAAIFQFKELRSDLLEFLAILAGALLLDPLVFFTCYFSLLHSPRHLLETAQDLGLANFQSIVRKSLPILIGTLILGGLFCLALPKASMSGRIVMTVFIGLAALTVPHMLLEWIALRVKDEAHPGFEGDEAQTLERG